MRLKGPLRSLLCLSIAHKTSEIHAGFSEGDGITGYLDQDKRAGTGLHRGGAVGLDRALICRVHAILLKIPSRSPD